MSPLSFDQAQHLVQIARDARKSGSFLERMAAIARELDHVIPFTNLVTLMVNTETGEAPPAHHVYHAKIDADPFRQYATYYSKLDPVFPWSLINKGVPTLLSHHIPASTYGRNEYTTDFLKAADIRHILGVNLPMPAGWTLIYSVQRSTQCPDFTEQDLAVARIVLPDVAQAAYSALLHERLGGPTGAPSTGTGYAVCTVLGEPLRVDDAARGLLLDLSGEGLPSDTLVSLVRGLGQSGSPWTLEQTLPLRSGGWVKVTFVRAADSTVAVVLRRLSHGAETFEVEATRTGLSPREREVARLAIRGDGNREIAHALGLSPNTVKHHLVAVYRKTKTTSKAELATLLLGGPMR